ncbi:hypothetical protein HRR83_000914 [Exophiala dermatitidis]|uniref:Calponin-homology (CH) domain-containing protein n=1 Tax=Exophiala dermatitidis TaxID=5970 RepID=A0AAN6F3Q7_EXODE|nr:hypothetical protein HRR75_000828 [Exophiala dermatitidis]KAJ4528163.1 hypothetical protein HRR74_000918 [Exophiala dermatitidis]KAJ4528796.1 hypothetical protein HRR73_001419 [Exophiala dermatitidis]KAJ4530181.1 hypothetical protein HRR76_009415 [Exophiala dermatitidis]KAJ4553124.1 hypothetical protein HRR78_003383 [Exophiala dermatitidis]
MLRLHEPSATPCPVPVLPPSSSRRLGLQGNGRRDSLLGMVSAGDDDTTAKLEFTSAFGAGTLRNNKPRRRQAAGRNKDNGPGFAIHEDANREDGKINMMEKRESALAQPAKRAVRLPGPSPAASQQSSRNHQAPPHPELARRLNKDPRRPAAMAPRTLDTLPEDSRLTINSTTVLKPARRGTIFIPNDDTTMPSMYMGIFSPIKNLDARLGSDAGEVEITGIAAQMAQKRSFRRSMITTSPKRAPLHVLGKDNVCSNVVLEDRIGQGGGKENVPPGHNAMGDEKPTRKASLPRRQSIQGPSICEMKTVETDVVLGTQPANSNRKDHPVQRQSSKAQSKTTRLYEPTASSSERNKERNPSRRPNAKPMWNSGSRLKQSHVPPALVESSRTNTIQPRPDQIASTKPAVPTRFIVPNVKVEALPDAYPLLTEDIAIPSMYEENWLSHQEISITQLVNNFFEASSPKQSSTEAGMLRIRLLEKYGNADSAMLYKRLQAALLFGALSIPSEVLRSAGRLNNDLGRRRAFTDLWLETYSLSCLQPALEVVVGRQCGIPSPGRRSSGNSTAPREALQRFIETFLVRNEDGSHSEQPGTDHGAWSYQRTLLRSLMLIKVLDMAKEPSTPLASGCLFQASSTHKTSVDVVKALFQLLNPSAGDPIRALSHVGYVVTHSQYPLEEYTYKIDNLAVDLRDGVRLTRLVELLLYPSATRSLEQLRDHESTSTTTVLLPTGELLSLEEGQPDWPLSQHLKFPCLGRATKLYNVQIALSAIQGVKGMTAVVQDICPEDIVDGYREKTVRLLWGLTSKWGLGGLVEWADVVREIKRLRRTIDNNRQHHSPIDYFDILHDDEFGDDYASGPARYQMLLKSWAQAIAAKNGLAVTNLTSSFADTRVFEAIVDEYEAYISTDGTSGSRSDRLGTQGTDSTTTKRSRPLSARLRALGCSEQFASLFSGRAAGSRSDTNIITTYSVFDRDFVLAALAFLCSRLLQPTKGPRAAVTIQRAWRQYWAGVIETRKSRVKTLAEECAEVVRRRRRSDQFQASSPQDLGQQQREDGKNTDSAAEEKVGMDGPNGSKIDNIGTDALEVRDKTTAEKGDEANDQRRNALAGDEGIVGGCDHAHSASGSELTARSQTHEDADRQADETASEEDIWLNL